MKTYITGIVAILIFTLPLTAQQPDPAAAANGTGGKEGTLSNYEKIADDTRFFNAYHFYEMKMYPKASIMLSEYVEVYSNGIHRKEAFMALGSIEFSRRNYERAAAYYIMLFEEFSSDEEGVEAYYRAAICYQKMGYTDRAERIFTEIVDRYPQSRLAQSARMQRNLDTFMNSTPQSAAVQQTQPLNTVPVRERVPEVISKPEIQEKTDLPVDTGAEKPAADNQGSVQE